MNISGFIEFKDLQNTLLIKKGEKGYDQLKKINNEGEWNDYVNEMLMRKTSVRYDYLSDSFIIVPLERKLKESFGYSIDDEVEEQPSRLINADEVKDLFGDIVDQKVSKEIRKGFETLRNDLFSNVSTHQSNEQVLSAKNLDTIKTNDDDLLLVNYDQPEQIHPDLTRIMGDQYMDYATRKQPIQGEEIILDNNNIINYQKPQEQPITCNETQEISGLKVRLILTGVLITEAEIKHIVDECRRNNLTVKQIRGKEDSVLVGMINESKEKVIMTIDSEKIKVKNYKFGRLNEALKFASKNQDNLEKQNFSKIYDATKKEKSLFHETEKIIKQEQTWQVYNFGEVNLKNGFNPKVYNLNEQKNLVNTLVKDSENNYYLINGTLNNRSADGARAMIYENKKTGSKFLGNFEVVGTYSNDLKGYGEVMQECLKTSVGLLFFK